MANYNETTITGSSWTRCNNAYVINEYGRTPGIIFGEQKIVMIDSVATLVPLNTEVKVTFDPNKTFPLLNPSTGEPTGSTYTHKQLYEILYSLYIYSAKERDAEAEQRLASLNSQGTT